MCKLIATDIDHYTIPELSSSLVSLIKKLKHGEDAYPILNQIVFKDASDKGNQVLTFSLSKMPEPDQNVSFEQLTEFKSDPDTTRKYYALIKWMNDVSKKDLPLYEIDEEYQYLYYEYANQYKLHKIKKTQGVLEVLVTAAIDVLCGTLGWQS